MSKYSRDNPFQSDEEASAHFVSIFSSLYNIELPQSLAWDGNNRPAINPEYANYVSVIYKNGYRFVSVIQDDDVLIEYEHDDEPNDNERVAKRFELVIRQKLQQLKDGVASTESVVLDEFGPETWSVPSNVQISKFDCYQMLPYPLSEYVDGNAQEIACAPESIAVSLLSSLGVAFGNTVRVRVVGTSWENTTTLWALNNASSAGAKTSAQEAGSMFLEELQREEEDAFQERYAEAKRSAEESKNHKMPFVDPPKTIVTNNTTIESLMRDAQHYPRGTMLLLDELGMLTNQFSTVGHAADKDFYNQAWYGLKSYKKTRQDVSLGSYTPTINVTINASVQPTVLQKAMASESSRKGEDGFFARFSLCVAPQWESRLSRPGALRSGLYGSIRELFKTAYKTRWAEEWRNHEANDFDFSACNAAVFKPPRDIIEWWPKYRQEKENEAHDIEATGQYSLSQWVNKSMAAAARLALLFYCVQRIQDGGTWIGDDGRWYDAMTLAIRWVDFLRPHAQRCFMTGLDTAVAQAMDGMLQRHSASLSAGKQMTAPQLMRGMSDKIRREYGDVAIDYAVALGRLRPAGGKGKRQYALGIG